MRKYTQKQLRELVRLGCAGSTKWAIPRALHKPVYLVLRGVQD